LTSKKLDKLGMQKGAADAAPALPNPRLNGVRLGEFDSITCSGDQLQKAARANP
jgi:hypothetical protein